MHRKHSRPMAANILMGDAMPNGLTNQPVYSDLGNRSPEQVNCLPSCIAGWVRVWENDFISASLLLRSRIQW